MLSTVFEELPVWRNGEEERVEGGEAEAQGTVEQGQEEGFFVGEEWVTHCGSFKAPKEE